ncbi:MAG: hypothetical protein LBE08_06980, partial [Bifidobacteriaceae bacterium]|nr:hypothetical protein [Bifidobacteriaceae bacterium]
MFVRLNNGCPGRLWLIGLLVGGLTLGLVGCGTGAGSGEAGAGTGSGGAGGGNASGQGDAGAAGT